MKKIILTTALLISTIFSYSQTNDDAYFNPKTDTVEVNRKHKVKKERVYPIPLGETDEEFIKRYKKEQALEELNDNSNKNHNKINDDIYIQHYWYGYDSYGNINSVNSGTIHYGTWRKCMNGYLVFMGILTTYVLVVVVSN